MLSDLDNKPLLERLIEYETEIRPVENTQLLKRQTKRLDDPQCPVRWMVLDPATCNLMPIEQFKFSGGQESRYENPSSLQ